MLSNLKNQTFTIINQIPKNAETATKTAWKKKVLRGCGMQSGIFDKTSSSMIYKANTFTAYISDWRGYKAPNWLDGGYYALSDKDKANYFTVNVGDLIVFAQVSDPEPTTLQEFNAMVLKYKDNGGTITGTNAYINFKPDGTPWKTNHIEAIKG